MRNIRFLLLAATFFFILGCAPQFTKITDSSVPLGTENYSILPPTHGEWLYILNSDVGQRILIIGRKERSPTHSTLATVTEIYNQASFSDPDDFLTFVKKLVKINLDPKRFKITEEEYELKEMFGGIAVLNTMTMQDNSATNLNGENYLVLNSYGYIISNPNFKNIIFKIDYSERGKISEIDPQFAETAKQFVDGIKLKIK